MGFGAAWNIFLAVLPVAVAWLLVRGLGPKPSARRVAAWSPVALAWLLLLPNAPYLFTGWLHFFNQLQRWGLLDHMHDSRRDYLAVLALFSFFFLYSGIGALTFAASLRPVHHWARRAGLPVLPLGIGLFLLSAFGLYLGLVLRFNSWDLVTRPQYLIETSLRAAARPDLWPLCLGGAAVLWLSYLLADVWLDGLASRWKRRGQGGRARSLSPA